MDDLDDEWPFYLSAAAVLDYQFLLGLPEAKEGPMFDRAEQALGDATLQARLLKDEGHRKIYRANVKINGKTARLEMYVTPPVEFDDKPPLVRVRKK